MSMGKEDHIFGPGSDLVACRLCGILYKAYWGHTCLAKMYLDNSKSSGIIPEEERSKTMQCCHKDSSYMTPAQQIEQLMETYPFKKIARVMKLFRVTVSIVGVTTPVGACTLKNKVRELLNNLVLADREFGKLITMEAWGFTATYNGDKINLTFDLTNLKEKTILKD